MNGHDGGSKRFVVTQLENSSENYKPILKRLKKT